MSTGSTSRPSTPQGKDNRTTSQNRMHVDALHVVVRPNNPPQGLEGAFRVHVLPESLISAGLKVGDLCEIACEDGSTGYGIAWRADDRMGNRPKHRPVKMTETIRTAFGIQEGSKVTISKTDIKIHRADKVVLCDVTPSELNKPEEQDDGLWRTRISSVFLNSEALAIGISFDIIGKKKFRKRYYIDNIESKDAPADIPCLFAFDDDTQIVFTEAVTSADLVNATFVRNESLRRSGRISTSSSSQNHSRTAAVNGSSSSLAADINTINNTFPGTPTAISRISRQHSLNTERIGGLIEQCRRLNRQLQRLLDNTASLNKYAQLRPNRPVLLHGYEGTGKTLLLNALADSGFRKVFRLNRASLTGGSVQKNQNIIQDTFQDAAAFQPSIILMDDLEKLAPTDDVAYSDKIISEIGYLKGKKVMVVAATRSPNDISSALVGPACFGKLIELPIPDMTAREQILNVLRGKPMFAKDSISSAIAAQTHGFTGKDVAMLYECAADYGADRYDEECEIVSLGRTSTPPAYAETLDQGESPLPGRSVPDATPEVTLEDFSLALQEVRPTALREIFTERPKIRWSDIGGSSVMKESFDEIIGWPLQHKDLVAKFQYQPPKGVLLYGPPGCSKTLTAQAVANTYNFNFIAIKGAELISMYVGESERAIREVFRKAKTAAPCVIFFDEIDAIGSDRDSTGTKGLNVLTTLLNEMDGFESLKDVFILAATNKPETLDPALMRPGRFDKHVYLGPPNSLARKEILNIATRNVALAGDVNFDELVADTAGYSGAEIVRICQTAKEAAMRRQIVYRGEGDARIVASDFERARRETKQGITQEMLAAYDAFSKNEEF